MLDLLFENVFEEGQFAWQVRHTHKHKHTLTVVAGDAFMALTAAVPSKNTSALVMAVTQHEMQYQIFSLHICK